MDDEEKAAAVVVIGLAIAGAIGAALLFMRKPAAGALSIVSPTGAGGGGWKNKEEWVTERNEDGFITKLTANRDVHYQ